MKIINAAKINNMQMLNIKNQAKLASTIQKIGRGKRKIEVSLSKSSQKYLEQMLVELKKQMGSNLTGMENVSSFLEYLSSQVNVTKGKKRPKIKKFNISYEEQDFLAMQIKSMISEIEKQKVSLKWYNIIKKLLFSSLTTQNSILLKEILNKK